ncbi:MAG: crossover junction endodeoxyribonuclease RuvC [Gammaproteobacteria bacterium]|nr:crossover junction endodeoxyribonuclease RuvC [Gammaproteobacteria bacterium]
MTIILGIDPGSRITGFGIIQIVNKKCQYVTSGCIKIKAESVANRLLEIYDGINSIIEQFQPTEAAIEQIFMYHSADSALKLGQARGVAIVTMATHNLTVAEYSARQVKQAVVGYGAADKLQVQQMVKTLLNLSQSPQADAADALAIAICHYHTSQSLEFLGDAKKTVRGRLR